MDAQVTFVQMGDNQIGFRFYRLFGNQDGDRCSHRVVVLAGNIENGGTKDIRNFGQYSGQSLGVVLFINIFQIFLAGLGASGVADIIDIEG